MQHLFFNAVLKLTNTHNGTKSYVVREGVELTTSDGHPLSVAKIYSDDGRIFFEDKSNNTITEGWESLTLKMRHFVLVNMQTRNILVIGGKSLYSSHQSAVTALQTNKRNEKIPPNYQVSVMSLKQFRELSQ